MANTILYPSVDTDAHDQGSYYSTKSPGIEAQLKPKVKRRASNHQRAMTTEWKSQAQGTKYPAGKETQKTAAGSA
ncbi:hypothetical protein N7519_007086 [Penicillium mononematosum]|uniref:uncharacterized protein n=1 Tax=Penicillium mononematosum TaxID=268346 RepID=UPI0025483E5C|nr:uncharacterized protein N7519_007086 [Penicillium mononematosum]KAJ6185785.1 hypothetical protein N7519_007086 [Penicillium mononematosum]